MDNVLKFLTRYVLIGLFVSVLIIAAAHVLEVTALPTALTPVDAFIQTNDTLRAASLFLRENLFWDYGSAPDVLAPAFDGSSQPFPPLGDVVRPVIPPEPMPPVAPEPKTVPAKPSASPPAQGEGPPWWGVVFTSTAKAYSTAGKFLCHPDPGSLFKISAIRDTKSGKLAQGYLLTGGQGNSQVLIAVDDLAVRPGSLTDVSTPARELCVREARLLGSIDKLRRADKKTLREDNPHTSEYAKAKTAYVDYWKKVKALQAERDASEGADHVRISDELQVLKGEDIRLGKAYEAAKQEYEQWNRDHPRGSVENSGLASLEKELSEVQAQLDGMHPAPQ